MTTGACGPYLALRFRPERISETLARTIRGTIPNRLAYFDALPLDLHPIVSEPEVGSRLVLPWLGRRRGVAGYVFERVR